MIAARPPRVAARRAGTLALVAVVCAATALVVVPSPAPLRTFVAFPVLVLVAGHHGTTLVLGHPRRRGTRPDGGTGVHGLLRAVLPALLGLLSLMAVVLPLGVARIPFTTAAVAVATGSVALVLVVLARWGAPAPARRAGAGPVRSLGGVARQAVLPAIGVLALTVAVAVAVALRPVPVERYTQLALAEPDVIAGRQVSARGGAPVTLRWTLRGYGSPLPATEPAVGVTVGPVPPAGVRVEVGRVEPGTAAGVVAQRRGMVTFSAPAVAGRHDVRLTVDSGTPLLLVVGLWVTT